MYGKSGKVCAVFYCNNYDWQRESRSFFRFPRDNNICAEWVKRCGRSDLDELFTKYGSERLNKTHRICAKHFQTTDLRNQNLSSQGLKKNTVPSLFLTQDSYLKRSGMKKQKRENSEGKHSLEEARGSTTSHVSVMGSVAEVTIKEEPFCLEEYIEVKLEEDTSIFQRQIKKENDEEGIWAYPKDNFPLKITSEMKEDNVLNLVGPIKSERSTIWTDDKNKDFELAESVGSHQEEIRNHGIRVSDFIISASLEGDDFITLKTDSCERERTSVYEVHGGNVAKASHKEKHTHSLSTKTYKNCEICGKKIYPLSNIKKHYLIHAGKGSHNCKICGKNFIRAGNLKIHIAAVHEGKKQYRCEVCGKTFPCLSHLKQQLSFHEDNTPYKCELGEKSFCRLSNLRQHHSIHQGKRKNHLKDHNLIHKGKRAHKSDIRGKYLTKSKTMKRHSFVHRDSEPLKCNFC